MLHWVCTKCQSKNSTKESVCPACGTSFWSTQKKERRGCLLLVVMFFRCVLGYWAIIRKRIRFTGK